MADTEDKPTAKPTADEGPVRNEPKKASAKTPKRPARRESELHEPLKGYLEGQGYRVHAEVGHCDLVARRGRAADAACGETDPEDEIIAVELKTRLSLDLLVQAAKRKDLTEAVYIAVPLEGSRGRIRNLSGVKTLLRRLEVGLFVVRFLRGGTRVEVLMHPRVFRPRTRRRRRIAMVREIDGRYAEFDRAGQSSREERITAYKQQSLLLAHLLGARGEASPAELRRAGAGDRAGSILAGNMYGWFDRVRRGVYRLTPEGEYALDHYAETLTEILRHGG
jgi:hypothetical protein